MTFTLQVAKQLNNNDNLYCIFLAIQLCFQNIVGDRSALVEKQREGFCRGIFRTACSWHMYGLKSLSLGVLKVVLLQIVH